MIAKNYTFISFVEEELLELLFEVGGYKDFSFSIRPIENGPFFIIKTHKQYHPSNIEVYVTDALFGIRIGKSSTQEFKECKPLLEYIERRFSMYYGIETSSGERTTPSWFKNLPLEEQAHWYKVFSTLPKDFRHILDMIGLEEEDIEGLNNKYHRVKTLLLKEDYEPLLELKDGNVVISLLGHPLMNLTIEMFLAITNNHNQEGEPND